MDGRTHPSRFFYGLAVAVLLSACDAGTSPAAAYALSGSAMGTTWNVTVVPGRPVDLEPLGDDIAGTLESVEASMSTWREDSELSGFNAYDGTDWYPVSAAFCEAVADSLRISVRTDGAFDVTTGKLVNLWGFGPTGDRSEPPGPDELDEAIAQTGYEKLHADCGRPALRKEDPALYVDLSAFAKGYAVDRVAELLASRSVDDFLVEVGGELRAAGTNAGGGKWRIAIEAPLALDRDVHRVVPLTDTAVATSGDYRNYFEYRGRNYSHTIDPRSGRPVAHEAASVTVVTLPAATADALATALLVLGPDAGIEWADRAGLAALFLVRADGGYAERPSRRFAEELGP